MCALGIVTSQDVRCLVGQYRSLDLYRSFSLLTHRHHVHTGCDSYKQLSVLEIIYPLLKLTHRWEERRPWFLSHGRRHEGTSSLALWKEGESGPTDIFHAAPKSVYTGRDKATVANHLNFVSVRHKLNEAASVYCRGFVVSRRIQCSQSHNITDYNGFYCILSHRVTPLASSVDTVKAMRRLGLGIVWVFFNTGAKSIPLKWYRFLNGAWTDAYKNNKLIIGLTISTKHMDPFSLTGLRPGVGNLFDMTCHF